VSEHVEVWSLDDDDFHFNSLWYNMRNILFK